MSQAAFRPHSILGQLSPLAWQHSYFRSPRSCPQPSCRRFAAVPELPGCSVSSGRAESGPAAQSSLIQDRGLRQQQQQQHCSTPTPPQTSWSAGRLASAAVLVSLAWADQAQAGVGESISEFIDARSSLTTALATIAFLLLLVLTAGVIYLSFSAWGDRTSESKDRRDAERAERNAAATAKTSGRGPKLEYEQNRSQRRIARKMEKEREKESKEKEKVGAGSGKP